MASSGSPAVPDEDRYLVVDGRKWRRTAPGIPAALERELVAEVMAARRRSRTPPTTRTSELLVAGCRTPRSRWVSAASPGESRRPPRAGASALTPPPEPSCATAAMVRRSARPRSPGSSAATTGGPTAPSCAPAFSRWRARRDPTSRSARRASRSTPPRRLAAPSASACAPTTSEEACRAGATLCPWREPALATRSVTRPRARCSVVTAPVPRHWTTGGYTTPASLS